MANHLVLLALDGRGDSLQLLGMVLAQGVQQQRILDGDRSVEVSVQLVALDIELAAQLQLHRLQTAVDGIAGLAVLLVVIRLRDGVAPVDHQRRVTVVRDTRGADVDVARRAIGAHLQADLGE